MINFKSNVSRDDQWLLEIGFMVVSFLHGRMHINAVVYGSFTSPLKRTHVCIVVL